MAIIARAMITLAQTVDISSVTWYYKLQASTASPPAKPDTATPSGWTTTEPTYTEGSTNSLYVCQKITYSDGTFEYADVSLSSSYEAAKTAYNKGVSALSAAQSAQESFESIGGRNLMINTLSAVASPQSSRPQIVGDSTSYGVGTGTVSAALHGLKSRVSSAARPYLRFGSSAAASGTLCGLTAGETYTLSFDASWKVLSGTSNSTTYYMRVSLYDDKTTTGTFAVDQTKNFGTVQQADKGTEMTGRCVFTFTVPSNATMLYLYIANTRTTASNYASGDYIEIRNVKLEKGSVATAWSPAPEDLQAGIAEAIASADDKNKNFYLPSSGSPSNPSEGDNWFKTDQGFALYRYTGGVWVKSGFGSAAFDTVDAGAGSVGKLSSLLVYKDDDNYWNLSANNYDEDFLQTNVEADIKYRANTLKTSHLVALEDVYVNGGPGSYLKIPTEADEQSYVELDNGGMTIKSRMVDTGSDTEFEILTRFPSSTDNDGIVCHSEMETTHSPSPGDPIEWRDYGTTYAVDGLYLSYTHGTGSGNNKTATKEYTYAFCYDEITAREDGTLYLWLNHSALTLGSVVHPMNFYLNNVNLTPIADAYPTDSSCNGACAIWHDTGFNTYIALAHNPSNNRLYVFASNSAGSVPYVGSVALQ